MPRHLYAALIFALASSSAVAKNDKHNDNSNQNDSYHQESPVTQTAPLTAAVTAALFTDQEKNSIRQCIGHREGSWDDPYIDAPKQKSLPPGLQKKAASGKGLPPGWQAKIARGEVLGMDVYNYGKPFPYDLCRQYSRSPTGTKILEAEGKIILIMEATRIIVDAFDL